MPLGDGQQPQDFAAILQRLQTLETTLVSLHDTVEQLRADNAKLRETVAKQDAIIRKYQAMLFGKKSEKSPPTSVVPPAEAEAEAPPAPATPPPAKTTSPAPKGQRGQRRGAPGHGRRLYEELPPRTVVHDLPAEARRCPTCGEAYGVCGSEDATTVEWEVLIRRVIHQRLKYRSACECQAPVILTAPPPPKLIPKGLLEVSAVANLVVNKFLHGQPINRQLHELALLCGVRFAPARWSACRRPSARCSARSITPCCCTCARPSTGMPMKLAGCNSATRRKPAGGSGSLPAPTPSPLCSIPPARAPSPAGSLAGRRRRGRPPRDGHSRCDRWKSYQGLDGLACAYCWAHVRRDFTDLAKGYPALLGDWARAWVTRIGTLYHLTEQRLLYQPGTEAFRQADATLREHVEAIARVRDTERTDTTRLLDARKALESLARHWEGLTLFLNHPWVPSIIMPPSACCARAWWGGKNFYGSARGERGPRRVRLHGVADGEQTRP